MISRVSKFYEVKIQYNKMQEDGKEKNVTEQYVVEAGSFTEAESRINEEMSAFVDDSFDVVAEKIAPYNEILISDRINDDKWFLSKVSLITLDEKTAKENKTSRRLFVQADTSQTALEYTKKLFDSSMTDYTIDAVQETPTIEVFLHDVKQETVDTSDNAAENNF